MRRPPGFRVLALALLAMPPLALADEPAPPRAELKKAEEPIKPLPPVAIPDDPPPHEGAMIEFPSYTIEPPDILVVEVLESLPGRPITGERLVRPDGTISLGFYGDVHVRGLTTRQAKKKLMLHLREFINDESLGIIRFVPEGLSEDNPLPKPGTVISQPEAQEPPPTDLPEPAPAPKEAPKANEKPTAPLDPTVSRASRRPPATAPDGRSVRGSRRPATRRHALARTEAAQDPKPDPVEPVAVPEVAPVRGKFVAIDPADSLRVFVDVSAFNSTVYYVQGDVSVPGRLPTTGKETVLDALNYAGGLIPTAEPKDIHLYRPARGGKPAKDYPIDLDAIMKGDAKANLQIFVGDRLIVGRNPIVQATIRLDRASAPINSVFNSILQYGFTARVLGAVGMPLSGNSDLKINGQVVPGDPKPLDPARRDAAFKEWVDFLWSISAKQGGSLLDEKAFREAMMKKLTPGPTPEPEKK